MKCCKTTTTVNITIPFLNAANKLPAFTNNFHVSSTDTGKNIKMLINVRKKEQTTWCRKNIYWALRHSENNSRVMICSAKTISACLALCCFLTTHSMAPLQHETWRYKQVQLSSKPESTRDMPYLIATGLYATDLYNYRYLCIICFSLSCNYVTHFEILKALCKFPIIIIKTW